MKSIAFVAVLAAMSTALPASAQYFSPYNAGNAGALVGVQTGHVSLLNGGILNGGILNGGILSGNGVAVGNNSAILSGNGILSGILNGNSLGLGILNREGKRW